MSSLDKMLPMEYVGPLAGGGAVPLATCWPGSETAGSMCNSGSATDGADCLAQGNTTVGAWCNSGSGTDGGVCYDFGHTMW